MLCALVPCLVVVIVENVSARVYYASNEVFPGPFSRSVNIAHSQGTTCSDARAIVRRGWDDGLRGLSELRFEEPTLVTETLNPLEQWR